MAFHRTSASRLSQHVPVWFAGAMLGTALLMIVGLIALVLVHGLGALWPRPLEDITLTDGRAYLGYAHSRESLPHVSDQRRTLYRIGNRDLYEGTDFVWVDDAQTASRRRPAEAVVVERLEWGPLYGFLRELRLPDRTVSGGPDTVLAAFRAQWPAARRRLAAIQHIERSAIGSVNAKLEARRLAVKRLELKGALAAPGGQAARATHDRAIAALQARYAELETDLTRRREEDRAYQVAFASLEDRAKVLPLSSVVRLHQPNRLSWIGKAGVYFDRLGEFIFGQPREANSEGGVAPAIFGTVLMTILMSIAVVPMGVLSALYLHEYAKPGPLVSIVRIAVNNLAGVPSIVFGVFGLGFFCYFVGGTIDQLWFPERLPTPTFGGGGILWASATLALLTIPVVIVATEEALVAVPDTLRAASLACGATKFQTIWNIVLPSAMPGVLTGAILAMARGAGEVAPLMITGVVKLAPTLPLDAVFPFLHLDRRFMHLGFHIYDVGFQSPNVEASKAMVYMTTLLLLGVIVCSNLAAMRVRARLREQFRTSGI